MVARTKSMIACLAAPSFHDGSAPLDVAVWAGADAGNRGTDRAGSNAKLASSARRSMPGQGAVRLIIEFLGRRTDAARSMREGERKAHRLLRLQRRSFRKDRSAF